MRNQQKFIRLAKEGSWIVIGQIAVVAAALVQVRVLTEYLDPTQYGQLALGLTVAGLVNQVVMGGINNGIGRYYSIAAENQDLHGYLLASRNLMVYATIAVLAIGLVLLPGLLVLGYSQWTGLAAAALVFAVLSGYNSTLSSIQNAARQRKIVAFHGGMDAWAKILLAVGLILWLGTSSTVVVIGYTCSSLLVTASQLFFLRRTIPLRKTHTLSQKQWMSQMWTYAWPFSTYGIFTWLQQVSDRWALQVFATTEAVGQYAVLFQLGYTPITMATGMAMSFIGPIMYQRAGDATSASRNTNVHRLGWQIALISLLVALLSFLITLGIHDWLFFYLVAPEYRGGSYLMPWIVLAGGIFASGQMLALKLLCELKSAVITTAKIVTALIGIMFNVIGAMLIGIHGVVGAVVLFSCIYFVWMVMLSRRLSIR